MAKNKKRKSIQKRSKDGCSSNVGHQNRQVEEFDVRGDKINDLSWYASKTQELGIAATTNFLSRAGRRSSFGVPELRNHAFPGILSIYVSPAFGINRTSVDPANVCAQNLFTYVRSANSGARNYDAIDLFIYYGAVTQLYAWLSYVRRGLHALDKYSYENQYVPKGMVRAMGMNYEDLRDHQAALEVYFNNVVTRASSLALPGDIDAIKRSIWIYENAYWDDASVQSQMYLFNPRTVLKYALDADGAGMLTEVSHSIPGTVYDGAGLVTLRKTGTYDSSEVSGLPDNWVFDDGTGLTYQNIVDITEELLSAIFYDQDIAIMSGDVLKAYGKEALFKLAPYVRGEVWNPVYDETALSMIENATLVGPIRGVELAQDPDKQYLVYDPYALLFAEECASAYLGKRILNFHKSHPSEADVIEATRLTVPFRGYSSDGNIGLISSCGAEIAEFAIMWRFYYNDDGGVTFDHVRQVITYTTTMSTGWKNTLTGITVSDDNMTMTKQQFVQFVSQGLAQTLNDFYEDAWAAMNLENFKQHPTIMLTVLPGKVTAIHNSQGIYGPDAEVRESYTYTPVLDADVYSFVDRNWLDNLNRACVQGLYLLKF